MHILPIGLLLPIKSLRVQSKASNTSLFIVGASPTTVALPSWIILHSAMPFLMHKVYDCFYLMIESNKGSMLFLDAPGGTCETFLINLILAKLQPEGKIALVTASSGIATALLTGSRTYIQNTFGFVCNGHSYL